MNAPTPTADAYADHCKAAATRQGLDPVVAVLSALGVPHEVEQTGGFVMVVTATQPDGRTFALTHEEGDTYLLGEYPPGQWHDSEEPSGVVHTEGPLEDLAGHVAGQFGTWH